MSKKPAGTASWWQTVPGILTGIAAIITAVTGSFVAYNALNHNRSGSEVSKSETVSSARGSQPELPAASQSPAGARGGKTVAVTAVPLPEIHRASLANGAALITILSAELEPIDAERRSLKFVIRYLNTSPYPASFSDRSYRLVVDELPRAPTNSLYEAVPGDSAKEGTVIFEIPMSTRNVILQISYNDEKRRIPFKLP